MKEEITDTARPTLDRQEVRSDHTPQPSNTTVMIVLTMTLGLGLGTLLPLQEQRM